MRISVLALLTLMLTHSAWAQGPVTFADATLKAAVEDALWVLDPTPGDMLGLRELVSVDSGITDISGLAHAKNLQHLNLRFNDISDISELAGLTQLRHLDLSRNYEISSVSALYDMVDLTYLNLHINRIEKISALSALTNLTYLDLHGNRIVDTTALSGMDKLRHLDLNENGIKDVAALSGLKKLETLYLHFNQIQDISALADLTSIHTLNIYLNEINDVSALAGLTRLRTLSLHYNQISDISALANLTQLTQLRMQANPLDRSACDIYLPQILANNPGVQVEYDQCAGGHVLAVSSTEGGSVTEPGEGPQTYEQVETVAITAAAHPGYRFLNWTGTAAEAGRIDNPNQAQTTLVVDATYTLEANFQQDIIHVDDDAPLDPVPYDLRVSDRLEDGTADHPFDSVQEAIEAAQQDALILVRPGRYYEAIDLLGKRIRVTGMDPMQRSTAALPIIDGQGAQTVVTFAQEEDAQCQLSGLVLTGGAGPTGGAVLCLASSPTIRNCLVVGNRCDDPNSAIIYCRDSSPIFENLTVHGNDAGSAGAAFRFIRSHAAIRHSIVWGNQPQEIVVESGPDPNVSYCDILGSWPGPGNLSVNPGFARLGRWATDPIDPEAEWIFGDYHLVSDTGRWDPNISAWVVDALASPCIDAGDPNLEVVHEPFPHGTRVNLGAYGQTAQASRSSLPVLAYWPFDETSGRTAFDVMGQSDARVHGAAWTSGKMNGALLFDGIDDYVDCGSHPLLAPEEFSLCVWIYPQANSASRLVLQKGGGDAEDYRFELFGARYPTFSFGVDTDSLVIYSNAALAMHEWVHVALTRSTDEAALYANGTRLLKKTYGFDAPATGHPLIVGGGDTYPYLGKIDDLRLYGSALSEEDIGRLVAEGEQ